jgi:hypothetical protein
MKLEKRTVVLFSGMLALFVVFASESTAQTADQGVFTFTTTWSEEMPLGDGTTLVRQTQSGMIMTSDADSPLNRAATTCIGSILMDADGVPTAASGHCDMVDIDGDVWTAWWSGGAEGGDWGFMASTGKFDGIQGSGKYWPGVAWADGRGINNWTVDYTMP